MSRVAIIVTCFNDGDTLSETVESIRAGAPEAELVIVNDGSTDDGTLRLLSQLRAEGVRVLDQDNRGPAAAGMAGVAATSAPYLMRFDADDLLEPAAAEALAVALDLAPDAVAAWGDVRTFGLTTVTIPAAPSLDAWLVTYTNAITGSVALLRRDAFLAAGGWQLRDGFEDWDLWMALAERGERGVHVPRVIFRYRRDRGGRFMVASKDTARLYDELRSRHANLFERRRENRKHSPAPFLLKLGVLIVDVTPGLSRLAKIQLCELLTRLTYGGIRAVAPMVRQAVSIRLPKRGTDS